MHDNLCKEGLRFPVVRVLCSYQAMNFITIEVKLEYESYKISIILFSSKRSTTVIIMTGKIIMPSEILSDSAGTQDLSVKLPAQVSENS